MGRTERTCYCTTACQGRATLVCLHPPSFNDTLYRWPEHKTPRITKSFLNLVHETRQQLAKHTKPLVVHCDRGFGPTGVFLALLRVIFEVGRLARVQGGHCTCMYFAG
jgi:hypothetical protein